MDSQNYITEVQERKRGQHLQREDSGRYPTPEAAWLFKQSHRQRDWLFPDYRW